MTDEEIRCKAIEYAMQIVRVEGDFIPEGYWKRIANTADFFEALIKKEIP